MRIAPNKLLMVLALAAVCALALVAFARALATGMFDDTALGIERIRFAVHPMLFALLAAGHLVVAAVSGISAWRTLVVRGTD